MRHFFLIASMLIYYNLNAQNASKYYALILKADDMIIENKLDSAIYYYNKAFNEFEFPFYSHVKRAAIIANFSNDEYHLEQYLTRCVKKGMPEFQFNYFIDLGLNSSVVKKVQIKYNDLYDEYLSSIDSILVEKYLELDAKDYFLHDYLYMYSKDSIKNNFYENFKQNAINEYVEIIEEYGYASEKNIGLPKISKYELTSESQSNNRTIELIDKTSNYIIDYNENPHYLIHPFTPGNWLLWHYASNSSKDSILLKKLEDGFDDLKLNQIFISEFFEGNGDVNTDFCTTYNSILYRTKYNSIAGKYKKSTKSERENINRLREKYFIKSLEKEEALLKRLYSLRFNKLKDISNRMLRKIQYEYNAFILTYNL